MLVRGFVASFIFGAYSIFTVGTIWWRERTAYLRLVDSGSRQPLTAREIFDIGLNGDLIFLWLLLFVVFTVYWLVELLRRASLTRAMGVTLLTMSYTTVALALLGLSVRISRLTGGGMSSSEALFVPGGLSTLLIGWLLLVAATAVVWLMVLMRRRRLSTDLT